MIDLERGPAEDFAAAMAPLFEGAPRFLERLAAARPFASADDLFVRAREIAHAMPAEEQIELLDAHPRLGAPPGSVSAMSFVEQGYDRDAADGAAEAEQRRVAASLDRLNATYEDRFGFRYCTFVAGRPRPALLPDFEAALDRRRDEELHRALDAVIDIAIDRHAKLSREEAR
ncbi:MAG TPA: 2-oxo-4-hydroxy-4-carboxy-5-ureidoimidazoline decarboxylase [Candidatus Limnocylindrales bacterium]|nr:2-oxo-4-hydroxy-4-carboxy-5-ureidoimidazoline decarboxylase [Candidatus Limnocylindrales bacterium]